MFSGSCVRVWKCRPGDIRGWLAAAGRRAHRLPRSPPGFPGARCVIMHRLRRAIAETFLWGATACERSAARLRCSIPRCGPCDLGARRLLASVSFHSVLVSGASVFQCAVWGMSLRTTYHTKKRLLGPFFRLCFKFGLSRPGIDLISVM